MTGVMVTQPPVAGPVPVARPAALRPVPALALAVAAGAALLLSFPLYGWWWAAPVGVAAFAAAVHRRRLRAAAGLGLIAGLVLFLPLLSWTNLHTGYLPWVLLAVSQAASMALLGVASAWVSPLVDRRRAWWPPVTGLLWVAQEALRDRAPFGGFPWGRLAFSQGDAPSLRLAALGGAPAVTFAVAVAGGALVALLWRAWPPRPRSASAPTASVRPGSVRLRAWWPVAGFAAAAAALTAGPALLPVTPTGGAVRTVAVVQGNVPRLGLDFNAQRRAVLDNHVNATLALAAQVAAGERPAPALVVWPENASDIDPLRNQDAARRIAQAADAIRAPILLGAVLRGEQPGQIRNAGLLWQPVTGPDLSQLYAKRHPVPFAEYVPLRAVARVVSTQVDRIQNMVAGSTPGVVRAGGMSVGDVICFEVAYDDIVRDTVTGGAQVLAVQTNNATFDEAEARQQLAMVRLRAVEHGRESLMVSTVGVSAFVGTSGRVFAETGFNTAAVVVHDMRLGGARTLATRLGHWPEVVAVGLAVVALLCAAPLRRRSRGPGTVLISEER
jgi:apolipoprotein N-acyltransferase